MPEIRFKKKYWRLHEKGWLEQRKKSWPPIQNTIQCLLKRKKALPLIKNYYLKGDIPDSDIFDKWDEIESDTGRHLDLFCFLWLHPSDDYAVLKQAMDSYCNSHYVKPEDIIGGVRNFISIAVISACMGGANHVEAGANSKYHPYGLDGQEELYFRLLYGDEMKRMTIINPTKSYKDVIINMPIGNIGSIVSMAQWLCLKELGDYSRTMLYQHELPLDFFFKYAMNDEPIIQQELDWYRKSIELAFYRIYRFDMEKEGDTGRTQLVTRLRERLDNRDYHPLLQDIWQKVKGGKIHIRAPWKL